MTRYRQRGQITVFLVGVFVALLLMAGLSIDGGRALAGRSRAMDEAEQAARTGAQHLTSGSLLGQQTATVDPASAVQAAQAYLRATGDTGEVTVKGNRVLVTVHAVVNTAILNLAGVSTITVTEDGSALAEPGRQPAP